MITNESSSLPEPVADNEVGFPDPTFNYQSPPIVSPDNPPWGVSKAVLTWILSVAFLIFVPLVFVVPYAIYAAQTTRTLVMEVLKSDKNVLFVSILGVIPAHLLTLGVAWIVVTNWGRYPFWETVGFTWPRSRPHWMTTLLSVGLAVVLLVFGGIVTSRFGGAKTDLDLLIESSYQARVATAFLAAATGPFVEELVYRGVLYPAFQRVLGVGWAVAIVSILFAGVHVLQYYNNLAVIGVITVLSITLTLVRARTGKLLPSFLIHLVFNGIQSLVLVVQPFFEKADKIVPSKLPSYLVANILRHLI